VASTAVGILSAHQAFYRLLETNEMGPFSGRLSNIFEDLWFDAEHSRRVSVVENVSEVLKKINAGIMVVGDTPHILRYCDLIENTERARATKIKSWIYHRIPGLMVKGRLYAPNGEVDVWPDLIK
jgi:hypothetical protein